MKSTQLRRLRTAMLLFGTVVLLAPGTAPAASFAIDDAAAEGSITYAWSFFDAPGGGMSVNGSAPTETGSVTLPETSAGDSFTGLFGLTAPLTPQNLTWAFVEPGGGISDILTITYTNVSDGVGQLTGHFTSDTDPGGNLQAPVGAILVNEPPGTVAFNNQNITAGALSDSSDVNPVPEPSSLRVAGAGMFALLTHVWSRTRRDQRRQRPVA